MAYVNTRGVWAHGQDGCPPLYIAAYNNYKDIADILVRAGADLNMSYSVSPPALYFIILS